jgi:hypothetical protein
MYNDSLHYRLQFFQLASDLGREVVLLMEELA